MSQVKINIVTNLVSKLLVGILNIVVVPAYLRLLGTEGFGLVGFYATMQPVLFMLDMGLSTTLNRELARLSIDHRANAQEMRDVVRTLEVVYWLATGIMAIGIAIVSRSLGHTWIHAQKLSPDVITASIRLMGIALAAQFPCYLYQGGLLGLQRQPIVNAIQVTTTAARTFGAVLILTFTSRTPIAFFSWQILVSVIQTIVSLIALWKRLPRDDRPAVFRTELFSGIWRFAVGMTVLSLVSVILMHVDKIVLSRTSPLQQFAYYTLASTVSSGLIMVVNPIFTAIFPKFSQLAALGDEDSLGVLYHRSCQLLAVLLMPLAIVIALFSHQILLAWTQNANVAAHAAPLLSLLTIGSCLNGLTYMPYALQLAYGWTRLTLFTSFGIIAVQLPALIIGTTHYGAIAACLIWIFVTATNLLVTLPIMHRRLLKGQLLKWLLADNALPGVISFVIVLSARVLIPASEARISEFATIAGIILITVVSAALAAPYTRGLLAYYTRRILRAVPT